MRKKSIFVMLFVFVSFFTAQGESAEKNQASLPRIQILATGGTIAGKAPASTQMTGYASGVLTVQALIDAVPEIKQYAVISGEQITNVSSPSLTFDILLTMAKRINELLSSDDVDGIVITHGTSTMEETAYFLNLLVKSDKPVVLVGAMRPATAISADGPVNLLNAVRLAGSKEARGKGVLMAMNDEISGARDATKTNTMTVETFKSPELGYLGYIQNGKPYFYRISTRRHTVNSEFNTSGLTRLPRVDIIYGYISDDAVHIEAAIAAGAKGIVVAAPGHGSLSNAVRAALIQAQQKGVVIVKSSRTGNGMITRVAEDDKYNFIAGDNLNAQKARILLTLALTKTDNVQQIQQIFNEY
jgi:L-asparaginase